MSSTSRLFLLTPLACALALSACDDHQVNNSTVIITPVPVGNAFAISNATGNVISFNRKNATSVTSNLRVQGLTGSERIVGIDVRPNTSAAGARKLYALTDQGVLYILDPSTGFVATPVTLKSNATTPINTTCTPAATAFTALSGTQFGVDFNPTVDRMRIVSDTGQNLRLNVDTGDVTVDCTINAAGTSSKNPSDASYTNSTGATTAATGTALFYIDASTDRLLTSSGPNGGTVTEVGALGVDVTAVNGFDIDGTDNNTAYAVMTTTTGARSFLYTINLTTGAATATLEFCGAGGTTGTAPNVTCVNAGESLRGLALSIAAAP